MERPTVLIICDQAEFSGAIVSCWQGERNSPSLSVVNSSRCGDGLVGNFDLAIAGRLKPQSVDAVLEFLRAAAKPVIQVLGLNGHFPKLTGMVRIPEIPEWPELLVTIAKLVLERERAAADQARLTEANVQLQHQASLGRYMLEMRHNLNNALTSLLGNSELMLLDTPLLDPGVRLQVETIRNMGMRMNEIMQRFSSLQKEFQLVEQQVRNKAAAAKSAAVGAD